MNFKVRKAEVSDAGQLFQLNEIFNGEGATDFELLKQSLIKNDQEEVFVAESGGKLVGFCCVQIFKSMCYKNFYAEITELFVDEKFRRLGVATAVIGYIEEYFKGKNLAGYQLFTSDKNTNAQACYEKSGFARSREIMYRKRLF
ncbi:GNAT family N-acetyltransferase [Ruminococcus sp. Marseille-P6503]|uniref:GNAT family N-acetyltransferase n=1 Tax=Ruminococcus sp. Marseille-P6503 TaxID=2364796 RepID=UPI000F53E946|nr:GNAT family N-acetyltransferase [Ruminococcus sp. Marseille-P6503]